MHRKLKIVNRKLKIENRLKGITLTEVVVASGLLIIAVVPILKALTTAHTTGRTIERKTQSLMLAQGELDRIKAESIYYYGRSFAQSSTALAGAYLCTVEDDADPNLRTISVLVGYDLDGNSNLASDEVEVTLTTYLARRWPGT
jgi:Tfp pilus assembly protein PilV